MTVENSIEEGFTNNRYEAKLIAISSNKETIYFQDSLRIFAYPINSSSQTINTFISIGKSMYGLNVDPSNGDIYCIICGGLFVRRNRKYLR